MGLVHFITNEQLSYDWFVLYQLNYNTANTKLSNIIINSTLLGDYFFLKCICWPIGEGRFPGNLCGLCRQEENVPTHSQAPPTQTALCCFVQGGLGMWGWGAHLSFSLTISSSLEIPENVTPTIAWNVGSYRVHRLNSCLTEVKQNLQMIVYLTLVCMQLVWISSRKLFPHCHTRITHTHST